MPSLRARALDGLAVLLVVMFPLALLFVRWDTGFNDDWHNHVWMIGQMSHYFAAHGTFPVVFNSESSVGIVFPVFYGYLLYPFLGLAGFLTTPNTAVRLACFCVYLLQFVTVFRASFALSRQRGLSFTIAAVVLWAIYPLSNLYNRGALPEFFAISLLLSVVSCWVVFITSPDTAQRTRWGVAFAFLLAWMFGIHPITAFYGSLCAGFAALAFAIVTRPRPAHLVSAVCLVVFAVVLTAVTSAPWLDAYRTFGSHLPIVQDMTRLRRYDGLDDWWIRLLPFPFDHRALVSAEATATPYLDTQINVPLLILLGWSLTETYLAFGWKSLTERSTLAALTCLGLAALVYVASVSPWVELRLSPVFRDFQIAYRMANYSNFFLLLAMLFAVHIQAPAGVHQRADRWRLVCRTVAVTVSVCALLAKLLHGTVTWSEASRFGFPVLTDGNRSTFVKLPRNFYGLSDYAIADALPQVSSRELVADQGVMFKVDTADAFGEAIPLTLDLQAGSLLRTNVYPFPWNRILENGAPVPLKRLAVSDRAPFLVYKAGASGPVRLEFSTEPSDTWLRLRTISSAAFWAGLAVFLLLPLQAALGGRR